MAKVILHIMGISTLAILSIFFVSSNTTNADTGYLNMSAQNTVKVCKDVSCKNPVPGIIDFKANNKSPVVIDGNSIKGSVWGNELGWITLGPDKNGKGGLYFVDPSESEANPKIGLLKGTAWSEISGPINFSVTGQKVVIDTVSGEWEGWAWASGP